MIRRAAWVLGAGLALSLLPVAAAAQTLQGTGVKLQGLDKISARIFAFEAPLDQPVSFGYLRIVARACVATPEDDVPESTAFLEVSDDVIEIGDQKVILHALFELFKLFFALADQSIHRLD